MAAPKQTSVVVTPGSGENGDIRRSTQSAVLTMDILNPPHTCYGAFR